MPDLTDVSDTIERAAYARLMGENHNPEDAHKSSLRVFAETAAQAVAPLLDAAEALERVKVLHTPTPAPTSMHYHCEPSECDQAGDGELRDECDNCREWYPCSTIRAVRGGA